MTALVLIAIVVMWLVVLVPMWLKRHDEVEETRSVDRFTSAMHTLSRRESDDDRRHTLMPHRKRDLEVHVSGASADGQTVKLPRRKPEPKAPRRPLSAATRRRRVLTGLALAAVAFLAAAVVHGGMVFWGLQVLADVVLVAFVAHLRSQAKNRAAAAHRARRRTSRSAAPARATSESRLRREAMSGQPTPRARPDEVFVDAPVAPEPELEPVEEQVYVEHRRRAARVGSEPVYAPNEEPFDQSGAAVTVRSYERAAPAPSTPAAAASADTSSPARRRRVSFEDPELETADSDQWDPVPVPRPVYTTKPPAPPRRRRAPLTEPLLPPAETAAELESGDELEEILDRRWAVND